MFNCIVNWNNDDILNNFFRGERKISGYLPQLLPKALTFIDYKTFIHLIIDNIEWEIRNDPNFNKDRSIRTPFLNLCDRVINNIISDTVVNRLIQGVVRSPVFNFIKCNVVEIEHYDVYGLPIKRLNGTGIDSLLYDTYTRYYICDTMGGDRLTALEELEENLWFYLNDSNNLTYMCTKISWLYVNTNLFNVLIVNSSICDELLDLQTDEVEISKKDDLVEFYNRKITELTFGEKIGKDYEKVYEYTRSTE